MLTCLTLTHSHPISTLFPYTTLFRSYRKNKNVKFIIRDSKKFVNYLARSEYLITDTTFPHYFNKRKEQKYIMRSEEHTSELQSRGHIVCRLLLEKKKRQKRHQHLRVY